MRLRSIELAGFKSFADRTTIRFKPGMTGIVGPNGCGKSNIVDALKWVLGTLSKKAIRGDEMMDVIFKGAEGIGPSGFAEVRLTFENEDRQLPIEADEVCVARRLYRNGESQYLLNGAACRRRDIRELFYGTGVGADTYSIIEQGKISRLILASAEERRIVFDEAAGVSKYRARKKEAEQKLARADQDLVRIEDRIGDAGKELHSLRIQAGRASRFKELSDELRARSLTLLRLESDALEVRRAEALARAEACRAERAELEGCVAALRTALGKARGDLTAAERHREQVRGDEGRLTERRGRHEAMIASATERLAETTADRERALADLETLEAKRRGIDERIGRASQERAAARVAHAAAAQSAEEYEARLAQAARECAAIETRLEQHNAEILELARKEAEHANDVKAIERDLAHQRTREERLVESSGKLEKELAELVVQQDALKHQLLGLQKAMVERRHDKKGLDREMEGLRETLARAQSECDALRADRERLTARLETLREIEQNREGLGSGVRALLAAPAEASGDAKGTVADFVDVPLPYAPAIEAALGDRATYVVVPDAAAARRAANFVRANQLDRTGIAALDGPEASPAPTPDDGDVVGRALDLIKPADEARGLFARLLGDLLVVRRPLELARPMVTLAGELIRPDGTRLVPGGEEPGGVITRRAEVKTLTAETISLDTHVRSVEEEVAATREGMKELGERMDEVREEMYRMTVQEGELHGEVQQLERRIRLRTDERRAAEAELADIARERELMIGRHARLAQLLDETRGALALAREESSQFREQVKSFARERERVEAQLSGARAETAKYEELVKSLDRQVSDYESERAESDASVEKLGGTVEELSRRRAELVRARDEATAARDAAEAEFAGLDERVAAAEARLAQSRIDLEQGEAEEGQRQEALAQNDERLRTLEISLGEEEVRLEHLTQRLRDEFQMTSAELPPVDGEVDRDALAAQVEELKAKIARFGNFNALALDRLTEVEERVTFLTQQRDDLRESKGKLTDLIKELNEEATKRFDETLQKVRANFGETFRKLFGGGKADVVLTPAEGVDPMDWGVEIMARPPKKELTTLSLLSGGEQSLTAVALVMSLFQANPSPFCVLDEADAALDESNVDRYTALVQEFVQQTQVIVITHRRRTMAAADILYGVSMERAGVTKLVNVDFKQMAAQAEN